VVEPFGIVRFVDAVCERQVRVHQRPKSLSGNERPLWVGLTRSTMTGERLLSLRVFGRLPVTGARARTEAGVRKASGEETAGEFAPAAVSDYGDLAPAFADFSISNGKDGRAGAVTAVLIAAGVIRGLISR
jgi:hypothetical protein